LLNFGDLTFLKIAADRHLVFLRSRLLIAGTVHRISVRHYAKFNGDLSKRSADVAIFRSVKMAAVRHVGF